MPSALSAAALVALLAGLFGVYKTSLQHTLELVGDQRVVTNSPHQCHAIEGLTGCEEQWIDKKHGTGLAYYACASLQIRHNINPSVDQLNWHLIPVRPQGYWAILDTKTEEVKRVTIEGGLATSGWIPHGFDLHVQNDYKKTTTIFMINHRRPRSFQRGPGADSVVEVFSTRLGSDHMRHVQTIESPFLITPNDLTAISSKAFYFTNDHRRKIGWLRRLSKIGLNTEFVAGRPKSTIGYCDLTKEGERCSIAYDGILYPNGIEEGLDGTIYVASTASGKLSPFSIEADHSLSLGKTIALGRLADNLSINPDGSILAAGLPSVRKSGAFMTNHRKTAPSEVLKGRLSLSFQTLREVQQITPASDGNDTVKVIFSDDGHRISGLTDATQLDGKLYLTGIASPHMLVCEVRERGSAGSLRL